MISVISKNNVACFLRSGVLDLSELDVAKVDTPRRRRLLEKWQKRTPIYPIRPFIDYAWNDYDPKTVASYLISDLPSFYRHKSILYAGFCVWVICPNKEKLRKDAMVYTIAKAIENAERPWRSESAAFLHSIGETLGRLTGADRRLFEEVYYPVGGMMRVLRSYPRKSQLRLIHINAVETLEALHLMAIQHFHTSNLLDNQVSNRPSKIKGSAVVQHAFGSGSTNVFREQYTAQYQRKINTKGDQPKINMLRYKLRSANPIIESWDKSRASLAYSYAAASINLENDRTLLHEIVGGTSTYRKHSKLLPEWFGRARFVAENIIGNCEPERNPYNYERNLLDVLPQPFEIPSVFKIDADRVTRAYIDSRHKINLYL